MKGHVRVSHQLTPEQGRTIHPVSGWWSVGSREPAGATIDTFLQLWRPRTEKTVIFPGPKLVCGNDHLTRLRIPFPCSFCSLSSWSWVFIGEQRARFLPWTWTELSSRTCRVWKPGEVTTLPTPTSCPCAWRSPGCPLKLTPLLSSSG